MQTLKYMHFFYFGGGGNVKKMYLYGVVLYWCGTCSQLIFFSQGSRARESDKKDCKVLRNVKKR